jgi:hypothetical protein
VISIKAGTKYAPIVCEGISNNQESKMAHRKAHAPVPSGNTSPIGKTSTEKQKITGSEVASNQEHDPKQRIAGYVNKGEHAIQEPGGKNGANH